MKSAVDFAKNFLVALLAIVLGLGALELILRVSPGQKPWRRTQVGQFPDQPTSWMVDPVIGWRFRPSWGSGDLLYRSNSLGFRGRDFDPSPKTRKIVLVGDSFPFGQGAPEDVSFSVVLEKRLHGTAVYNLAIPGFGVDQMWLTLRHYGLPLHPNFVIVAFIDADLARSVEAYSFGMGLNKPVFEVVGNQLIQKTAKDRPAAIPALLEHSLAWRLGRQAYEGLVYRFPVGERWRLNKAILDRVRSDCAEAGVTPLFVRIPTPGAHRQFPTLHDYMSRAHANFIDLLDDNRLPLVGTTLPDGHLNATGHRYMAGAVAAWIAANRPDL
jgi:hypothetical protein